MTPEESDARLRKIHEEWRRWCAAHPTGDFRQADETSQQDATTAVSDRVSAVPVRSGPATSTARRGRSPGGEA